MIAAAFSEASEKLPQAFVPLSPELHLQHPTTVPPEGRLALSDDTALLICSSLFHTDILALTSPAAEISLLLLRITALLIPHLTPNN